MDEKISLNAIAEYADRYSEKVLKGFFNSGKKAGGKELLALCNVHQVNLFVVRELFKAWKEETARQKSVYFDYENEEVKEALAGFMSVLSNHISVGREDLAVLLKEAVRQTLMLIFNPYDFYSALIAGRDNQLDVAAFREELKYLRINHVPLERMLLKLEEKKIGAIAGNEAFAVLDQILEEVNFTPEDLEGYIQKFSIVTPLDPEKFYTRKPKEPASPEPQPPAKKAEGESLPYKPGPDEQPIPTLNDRLNSRRQPALIDSFQKILKIKENLTINQKFMFTKVLFYGDFESFSRAIDDIDRLDNMDEALQYLEKHSSAWDRESREFHEFMEMVEKRFT